MSSLSLGDLAQVFQLRHRNLALKTSMGALSEELSTGISADPGKRLKGDFVSLSAIESSLHRLGSYEIATNEAALAADVMQKSLSSIGDSANDMATNLLMAGEAPEAQMIANTGMEARDRLEQAIAALNTSVAGRALFAGAATDATPLATADSMLSALKTEIAAETTAGGAMAAIKAWFDTPGGGFETLAYGGASKPSGPVRLADGQNMSLDVTAADPALRDMLRGLASAALLSGGGTLAGDVPARAELARQAGEQLLTAQGPLSDLRALIGTAQNRIETVQAENASQTSMLEIARTDLIGADPYDTATELQEVQGKLETLYTITARMARLSLADYLS